MQRKFIISLFAFFIPVVLGYLAIEYATLRLPMSYTHISKYIAAEAEHIEVLALGSSQVKNAINPALIDSPTLNLASGDQHHDTDFKLLRQLLPKLPSVKTVILEVSYGHFELPHNGPNFWKNSVYLKYYGANNFERNTYFKDKLLYVSFPKFFSKKLNSYYINGDRNYGFNKYGYDTLNYEGLFKTLNYNEEKISEKTVFKINKVPNKDIFKTNTQLFFEMLAYLEAKNIKVILVEVPMYKTYPKQRVPEILARRDSIVALAKKRYPNVELFLKETDTIHYNATHFWNQSHLNPKGGAVYSSQLNDFLNSLNN
jgi:hypothetical protein